MAQNKKIALIIAQQDFRDEEAFIPRSLFLKEGFEVKIVSLKKDKAIGVFGGVLDVDLPLEKLNVSDFDAIVFAGGGGASKYIDNPLAHKICRKATEQRKILGAICIAPTILARSGVLKNKKATVWHNKFDKSAVKILKKEGAIFTDEPVVIDDKIVTANGPQAARDFAQKIIECLK